MIPDKRRGRVGIREAGAPGTGGWREKQNSLLGRINFSPASGKEEGGSRSGLPSPTPTAKPLTQTASLQTADILDAIRPPWATHNSWEEFPKFSLFNLNGTPKE